MPVMIKGESYCRTVEVCRIAGISRNTLFRWLKVGLISEPELRDWRGWRLYSQSQVDCAKARTSKVGGTATKRGSLEE
jgi:predicted site-specific integrase-resolvase